MKLTHGGVVAATLQWEIGAYIDSYMRNRHLLKTQYFGRFETLKKTNVSILIIIVFVLFFAESQLHIIR